MQDRVSLHPGRVTLAPVAGQANTYDMERADEPTQAGTPLNKASLLKDTTAALYGLTASAVPDDVLAKIQPMIKDGDAQVGDILATMRSDPGEAWRLCNGDFFSKSDFPTLGEIIFPTIGNKSIGTNANEGFNASATYNGMWVLAGNATIGGNSNCPVIWYTTDPAGEWTEKILSETENKYVNGLDCYNGLWVACGYDSNSTATVDYTPVIWYTTDPAGEWTEQVVSFTESSSSTSEWGGVLYDIACHDGVWVIAGTAKNSSPKFFTATDITGTWTMRQLRARTGANCVACYNGLWISGGNSNNIYYTENPASSWSSKQITLASGDTHTLTDIACHDGVWVATTGTGPSGVALTTTDPTGDWTNIVVPTEYHGMTGISSTLYAVAYCGGQWIFSGRIYKSGYANYIIYSTDLSGELTLEEMPCAVTNIIFKTIATDGTNWIAGTQANSNYPGLIATIAGANLPVISTDGVYTYIKAKE